ncbi:hypothetical protein TRFO_09182 [Tritrichomonas foetus]|uniref:Uncharacterized protein n=1 Tax=Tritrichomonas foetus TaxID=1144522 RepID=A0A1J4JFS6_9EUKA|nr:hypothetical protein TRFO_09182 [Tritrichomonas foetus]|eukprot:OHS98002.1 hypothetical protein TRFO_09182 [Tritrichomonas foetus]
MVNYKILLTKTEKIVRGVIQIMSQSDGENQPLDTQEIPQNDTPESTEKINLTISQIEIQEKNSFDSGRETFDNQSEPNQNPIQIELPSETSPQTTPKSSPKNSPLNSPSISPKNSPLISPSNSPLISPKTSPSNSVNSPSQAATKPLINQKPLITKPIRPNTATSSPLQNNRIRKSTSPKNNHPNRNPKPMNSTIDNEGQYECEIEGQSVTEERCRELIERFKKNKKYLPDYTERPAVLQYVVKEGLKLMLEKKYKEADEMCKIREDLVSTLLETDRRYDAENHASAVQSDIEQTKDLLHEAVSRWEKRLKTFEKDVSAKISTQQNTHEKEIVEFDEYYNNLEHFRKYSKPSPFLLHLRTRERKMVICHEYSNAKFIRKKAERLEKEESEIAQRRAEDEIIGKKEKLLNRHEAERERLNDYCEKLRASILKERQNEIDVFHRRLDLLYKIKQETLSNIKNTATVSAREAKLDASKESVIPRSPRTLEEFNQFRVATVSKKLQLKPISGLAKKCRRFTSTSQGKERNINDFP